mmetsp:Transcript_8613/g.17988  ORF Transcript_8613/g.17988 Transcript_8613/m.17988 type:complete len:93 (+) Transcript_8613:539-817(+)
MPSCSKCRKRLLASKLNIAIAPNRRVDEKRYVPKINTNENMCWKKIRTLYNVNIPIRIKPKNLGAKASFFFDDLDTNHSRIEVNMWKAALWK